MLHHAVLLAPMTGSFSHTHTHTLHATTVIILSHAACLHSQPTLSQTHSQASILHFSCILPYKVGQNAAEIQNLTPVAKSTSCLYILSMICIFANSMLVWKPHNISKCRPRWSNKPYLTSNSYQRYSSSNQLSLVTSWLCVHDCVCEFELIRLMFMNEFVWVTAKEMDTVCKFSGS